jgi:BCD family chlorophyll transporter-like MFS transporter
MNAYFMQELILEPFAGLVFEFTPGQSTKLSGVQNGGVFAGMLTVGIVATGLKFGALRHWVVAGCVGSAVALVAIAMAGVGSLAVPLFVLVVGLGFFNGMFAVAAIGSMMALASEGRGKREGTRMGLWGAAQAIAAGFGGLLGAAAVDVMRLSVADGPAFGVVFLGEAGLFLAAAFMALHVMKNERVRGDAPLIVGE